MGDFFDPFGGFDREIDRLFKLAFNRFNRPVKDMQPYSFRQTDNGYTFVINTLGINKNDVSVEIKNKKGDPYRYLTVSGETKMEKVNFENNVNISIRLITDEEIEELAYEVKDGLTIVYIKTKQEKETKSLEARFIEDSTELGF